MHYTNGMRKREELFGALAHPLRLRILEMLVERERTAGEVATAFVVSRPAVSRHLRVLREGGLVRCRGRAQQRIYSLDPEALDEVGRWAESLRSMWAARLDRLEEHLDGTTHEGPGRDGDHEPEERSP
jgi:DNA-binding transcriptional ArsR family regulator